MAFRPGEQVHVAAFGKGIVREVRNARRYVVEVKGRAMVVEERQLTAVDAKSGRRHSTGERTAAAAAPEEPARAHAAASVDLHGMTVEQALAAVDEFLNDAILAGLAEVRVIHGRSGGRLRSAVHRHLRVLGAVRDFRIDPVNPGVTIITF